MGAVRQRDFYLAYAVPDTFEGRFELLALHAGLVLRRFNAAEGRVAFPLSVQAHHGLVDGLHIHQLIRKIEATMAEVAREVGRG